MKGESFMKTLVFLSSISLLLIIGCGDRKHHRSRDRESSNYSENERNLIRILSLKKCVRRIQTIKRQRKNVLSLEMKERIESIKLLIQRVEFQIQEMKEEDKKDSHMILNLKEAMNSLESKIRDLEKMLGIEPIDDEAGVVDMKAPPMEENTPD